jgi:hypothetical protein
MPWVLGALLLGAIIVISWGDFYFLSTILVLAQNLGLCLLDRQEIWGFSVFFLLT